jgi:hypothetical protein
MPDKEGAVEDETKVALCGNDTSDISNDHELRVNPFLRKDSKSLLDSPLSERFFDAQSGLVRPSRPRFYGAHITHRLRAISNC